MVVVGFAGCVETPCGLRALTSVWAGHFCEECGRSFYKTWHKSKHKSFTKYEKRWSEASKGTEAPTAAEFSPLKAVMLASLRSLRSKGLGIKPRGGMDMVLGESRRMLKNLIGKLGVREKALEKFYGSLDDKTRVCVRREVYARFFAISPAGQD